MREWDYYIQSDNITIISSLELNEKSKISLLSSTELRVSREISIKKHTHTHKKSFQVCCNKVLKRRGTIIERGRQENKNAHIFVLIS